MARYLAIYEDDFGSALEVYGFTIMTDKELTKYEELAESITWEFNYFTTDEDTHITYTSGEDLLNRISFKEITKDEYTVLNKLFDGTFGNFPGQEFLEGITEGVTEGDEEYDDYEDD